MSAVEERDRGERKFSDSSEDHGNKQENLNRLEIDDSGQRVRVLRRICVYCGASSGVDLAYSKSADDLGIELTRRGIGLVYGGGDVGLMGVLARAVFRSGGEVIGIIPKTLVTKEVCGNVFWEQIEVSDMHERKKKMFEMADGFIALPGGFGTLEELLEMITWSQLGIHEKPIALLNPLHFFDSLLAFFQHAVEQGFIKKSIHDSVIISDVVPSSLLDKMESFKKSHKSFARIEDWARSKEMLCSIVGRPVWERNSDP